MSRTMVALAAVWLGFTVFIGSLIGFRFWGPAPDNFYGLQTEAFQDGHLALEVMPDPHLARLADPYEGSQNLPYRIQDLSYYRGRYYSYFGVGPIICLLWPWRLVTRTYLRDQGATALLEIATQFAALVLLLRLRRHLPSASGFVLTCAYILVTVGSWQALQVPPTNPGTVAQASAYLWFTLGLLALHQALCVDRPLWTCAVSLCVGMMVASRPSFLPGAALLGPLLWRSRLTGLRSWAAALVPVTVIAAGLLAYNFARFDSPFEFGVRLQLVDHDYRHVPLLTLGSLAAHLGSFLTRAPRPLFEYPFLDTGDVQPIGLLWACPAVLLAIPPLASWRRQGDRVVRTLFLAALLCAFGLLLFLAAYRFYLFHYSVDFFVTYCWAGALGWLIALERDGPWRRWILTAGAATIAFGSAFALLFVAGQSRIAPGLAAAANTAAFQLERLAGANYGPARIQFRLQGAQPGKCYPLLSAGRDGRETCYLRLLLHGRAQFGVLQGGLGPVSVPIDFDPHQPHSVEVRLGGLIPPPPQPLYRGWTELEILQALDLVEVIVDGRIVLAQHGSSDGSEGGRIDLGRDRSHAGRLESTFPGVISYERGPLRKAEWCGAAFPRLEGAGVALTVQVDAEHSPGSNQPLVSFGLGRGAGTVYLRSPDPLRAIFGADVQNYPAPESPAVAFDIRRPHRIEVYPPDRGEPGPLVVVDGLPVLRGTAPALDTDPLTVFFGSNASRSSVVQPEFCGALMDIHRVSRPDDLWAVPNGGVAVPKCTPVEFDSQLYGVPGALGQPLLASGATGRADVIFLRAAGSNAIVVERDHWGFPATHGGAVPIDPRTLMHWRIELPAAARPGRPGTGCRVTLNGRVVFESPEPPFDVDGPTVVVGANPAGGSLCGPRFQGLIFGVKVAPTQPLPR